MLIRVARWVLLGAVIASMLVAVAVAAAQFMPHTSVRYRPSTPVHLPTQQTTPRQKPRYVQVDRGVHPGGDEPFGGNHRLPPT